jgi:hypothetical protein
MAYSRDGYPSEITTVVKGRKTKQSEDLLWGDGVGTRSVGCLDERTSSRDVHLNRWTHPLGL